MWGGGGGGVCVGKSTESRTVQLVEARHGPGRPCPARQGVAALAVPGPVPRVTQQHSMQLQYRPPVHVLPPHSPVGPACRPARPAPGSDLDRAYIRASRPGVTRDRFSCLASAAAAAGRRSRPPCRSRRGRAGLA